MTVRRVICERFPPGRERQAWFGVGGVLPQSGLSGDVRNITKHAPTTNLFKTVPIALAE